jgi:Cdc6-like AAA superfamily ATPase
MKFYEDHFVDYVSRVDEGTLHSKLCKEYDKLPDSIDDLNNMIFYGPDGVGKYSQSLNFIKKYSASSLKYEKKIMFQLPKQSYNLRISDVHFEIDMEVLGCNSKTNWNSIYSNIIDIINTKKGHKGIILCKNFQCIHNELLEVFYSYIHNNINIKYFILTSEISFIPDIITNKCKIINVPFYSKTLCKKMLGCKGTNVSNIKYIKGDVEELEYLNNNICNKLISVIIDYNNNINYAELREHIYSILTYNMDINNIIWYIIKKLIKDNKIKSCKIGDVLEKTFKFFHLYNNNYRPIYHLENYFYYLVIIVNEL